jgi:hypothetical protein
MGAWGIAIFAADDAGDLRDDYRDLIAEGVAGPEATDRLVKEWDPDTKDPYAAATFWLSLAITQWKCGRLEDRVRQRALAAIADGSALTPWEGSKDEKKRVAALAKARRQLTSPPPPPTRIKRSVPCTCAWEPTELVAYKLRSGDYTILRVTDVWGDEGGTYPSCEVLDWHGKRIPDVAALQGLSLRPVIRESFFKLFKRADQTIKLTEEWSRICILGLRNERIKNRFLRLNIKRGSPYSTAPGRLKTSGRAVLSNKLDQDLEDWFGLK